MNRADKDVFSARPAVIVDLPLAPNSRILHPETVIVRLGATFHDLGAFCYAARSDKRRKPGQPREVVASSLLRQRQKPILQAIKVFTSQLSDAGKRPRTVSSYIDCFEIFMAWADANGLHDCLAGGDATWRAYQGFVDGLTERYARHEIEAATVNQTQRVIAELLEAVTGAESLTKGVRRVSVDWNQSGGTEPASPHDFSHAGRVRIFV